ncbi:glycosyltransferase family 4 protein [Govanella unica]|uniref:Glycosyltransferase family 1 protein n=1 Tax=Govanella unica TaxID=2975056 RepID=A0A9X3TYX4_9PROT|nr:glycosyltransferase family 1 protein [Govania unica]MDA5194183.1 glycosyltransferase family 1 protein [Govania unica]
MKTADLRVALFSGNYNYIKDGANQALNRLVAGLESQGAAVRIYSPTSSTPAFEPAGTLISVPSISIPRRREYRLALGMPGHIRDDIIQFSPNIFHVSAPDLLGYQALTLAEKMLVPAVASVHTRFETYLRYYHLGLFENLLKSYFRHFYHRCVQIYAPSESMAEALRDEHMAKDIQIWGRGVDSSLYAPARRDMAWRRSLGIADTDIVIAFVGRLVLEKGLGVFCKVIKRLEHLGITHKVLIIGDGPERKWFEASLPQAIFTGFLTGEKLARAFASSDIFFNPSQTETFGNVTLEAMASGLPTVGLQATGSSSLIIHDKTGFLCAADDLEDMTTTLARLVQNADLRDRFGKAARAISLGQSWDQILFTLFQNYITVVANTTRARQDTAPTAPDFVSDIPFSSSRRPAKHG